jgi:hypothetical protein
VSSEDRPEAQLILAGALPLDRHRGRVSRFWADVRQVVKTAAGWGLVALLLIVGPMGGVLDALVPTNLGAQTILQIVTPAIIAVFALALASVFVLAQHTAAIYGPGVVRAMVLDRKLRGVLTRPIVLAFAAIILAGQVRTSDPVPEAVAAGVVTIALATCVLILRSAIILAELLYQYGTPEKFSERVVGQLKTAARGSLVRRQASYLPVVGPLIQAGLARDAEQWERRQMDLLREMVRGAIARKQSEPFKNALSAVLAIEELRVGPEGSGPQRDELIEQVGAILLEAGRECVRAQAAESDLEHVLLGFGAATRTALRAGREPEAIGLIDSLTRVGCMILTTDTASRQPRSPGPLGSIRFRPLSEMAAIEAEAEQQGARRAAAAALVGWAVIGFYLEGSGASITVLDGLAEPPRQPPWREAKQLVRSEKWRREWCRERDQQGMRKSVLRRLVRAERDHANLRFMNNGFRESVVGDGLLARVFRLAGQLSRPPHTGGAG